MSDRADPLAGVTARVERLEALESVKNVVARYALAADARQGTRVNLEGTLALFAADATWDGGPRYGKHTGHDKIRAYLSQGKAGIDWSIHQLVNVALEISTDLRTAKGRWYLLEMARMGSAKHMPGMVLLGGIYDNEFVNAGGQWKFSFMRFDCQTIVETPEVFLQPSVGGSA